MELLKITMMETSLEVFFSIFGIVGLFIAIMLAFGWEIRYNEIKNEKIWKYSIITTLVIICCTMLFINTKLDLFPVYKYHVTEPEKVIEKLENGYQIYNQYDSMYELIKLEK